MPISAGTPSSNASHGRAKAAPAATGPWSPNRSETRAVFLFGFAKNDQDNIDDDELKNLRKAAAEMLGWNDKDVTALVAAGKWTEVKCDD